MRLLEFGREDSGANPLHSVAQQRPPAPLGKNIPTAVAHASHDTGNNPVPLTPVDGIKIKQAQRTPVDLEHLKQRIDLLERRMRTQSEKLDELASVEKLDQLKQRMLRLEQCLQGELWTARQREHTLLEMLQKPPFTQRVKQSIARFLRQDLPAADRWLRRTTGTGWQDLPVAGCWLRRIARTGWTNLPSAGYRLQGTARNWWRDNQPGWWPQFVHAWQESLEQARTGVKHN